MFKKKIDKTVKPCPTISLENIPSLENANLFLSTL